MVKKNTISSNIFIQNSTFKKAVGLMFRKEISDFAMIFPFNKDRRIGVTMCCVFFPIDVIFLDDRNIIIEYKKELKPFQTYTSFSKEVRTFIELPEGSISKFKLDFGSKLEWNEKSLICLQ